MTGSDTLLAHLVLDARMTPQVEVAASRSLVYVLNKSESVRRSLAGLVKSVAGGGPDAAEWFRAEVHYKGKYGVGRIDFVGYDDYGRKRVVGEAKFDANLLPGQAGDYLHQVANPGPGVLMFVVPDYRIDYLWGEVQRDVAEYGRGAKLGETKVEGRIHSAKADYEDADWRLVMVSWRDLLDRIAGESEDEDDVLLDIRQLKGITERMDTEAFKPLTETDLDQETPRRLLALQHLVNNVVILGSADWLSVEGFKATATTDGYVRYFKFVRSGVKGWFGLNYTRWSKSAASPLWFGLQPAGEHRTLTPDEYAGIEHAMRVSEGCVDGAVPIALKIGADYQEVLADVSRQLQEIGEKLGGAVPARGGNE